MSQHSTGNWRNIFSYIFHISLKIILINFVVKGYAELGTKVCHHTKF